MFNKFLVVGEVVIPPKNGRMVMRTFKRYEDETAQLIPIEVNMTKFEYEDVFKTSPKMGDVAFVEGIIYPDKGEPKLLAKKFHEVQNSPVELITRAWLVIRTKKIIKERGEAKILGLVRGFADETLIIKTEEDKIPVNVEENQRILIEGDIVQPDASSLRLEIKVEKITPLLRL